MDQRDKLFAYLLEREGFERQSEYTISRRQHDGAPPPLSFSQERFWFLDQFEHARPVYNGCKVIRLDGELRPDVLAECLDLIARRHEVMRATYPAPDGRPTQQIAAGCSIKITASNLEHLTGTERLGAIERLIRDEWLQPIELSEELPIRARLARIADREYLLILTLHQIVFDSASVAIFFRELWTAYGARLNGEEPQLPALPVQYADFAIWQRSRASTEAFQSEREFWIQQLGGVLPVLNLSTDKPRPPTQRFDGSRLAIRLPATLQLKLKELSRKNGTTLFMTLLAAFKTLLYRYTAQEDLLVGCPMVNRRLPEIKNLLGSFVNTLVLRTNYSGRPSFREVLQRVRETCVRAFAHQDFPFEKLVEELQPQRDLGRNPIFQVMFAYQNTSLPALELPGLRSELVEADGGMTKFDFTLSLIDKEDGIAGHIEYSTDLFYPGTIERMARHFQNLLEGIVAGPDQSIATLQIMGELERRWMVLDWNDTAAAYPKNKCIHELFAEQVERTPDVIALKYQDKRITYRELNRKANQLANYLIALGVGPEKLVGLGIERSLDMVVALLGILKAGGAYVPVDPSYPNERLAFMLDDASVSIVVTQEKFLEADRLKTENGAPPSAIFHPGFQAVCLDRDWAAIEEFSDENPGVSLDSAALAYVIYTSGSTGLPKGVQVSHRPIVNCLSSIAGRLGFTRKDILLAVTTISFDIAALELYLPLLAGGTVILATRAQVRDGSELLRSLEESSATAMQATPSLWRLLLESGWEGTSEFKILCGGESMTPELAEALLRRGEAWNLYGPTETTIWSMLHRVESGGGAVVIGRPIANTQVYILDSQLRPVPIGVHGELYIGGDGLARDYLNRPELTAEKFLPNPFIPGERLYRTGDRARHLENGEIEFLGRIDNQVKVRGQRVELGEIETVLDQYPAIQDSVVLARARGLSEEKELIGYVVPLASSTFSLPELRGFLQQKLPEYMVPSQFIALDHLPVTPNGKIDRNSLPAADGEPRDLSHELVIPRTEVEECVAQVWREVLRVNLVGIHDNFFELGGHSLLATRVMARLRNNFGIDLPLRKLFELPTVAGLADHIRNIYQSQSGARTPPIVPVPRNRSIPASFSQQRLWFLREMDPKSTAYNIPSVFSVTGPLELPALEKALDTIVARHEILRTTFDLVEGVVVQEIRPVLRIDLHVRRIEALNGDGLQTRMREIALEQARKPFDLRHGPLIRAGVLKAGAHNHFLLFQFDHAVLDGSSMAILFRELGTLYEAFTNGHSNPLLPLTVQYADYAAWEREVLDGDVLGSQLEYWKRQLTGMMPLRIPADCSRAPTHSACGSRKALHLSKELTHVLKDLSRREGVTIFMTLLAAFQILLSRHTGQNDVVIGSTISGRSRAETEELIGFFVNALPLRTDLSGNPSFLELLKRVREVCLSAYTHQDLPFEKIVEAINPARDFSRNPLFQVMFNMAEVADRELRLAGCEVTKEAYFDLEAKFDITLHAPEKDGAIELAAVYNRDLFSAERVAIMLEQLSHLLSQVAEKPQATIGEYTLGLSSTRALLPDPSDRLDDTWQGPIYAYLERWAERAPERHAVAGADGSWTYRELEACSNRLANYLMARGVQAKDVVAVYAHRSSELIAGLLGILKAGAAFVILDPAYPASRLIAYLRISGAAGWIQLDAAEEPSQELATCLDSLELSCRLNLPQGKQALYDLIGREPDVPPPVVVGANDLAYVAFTSGTMGEPKGVTSRHGPITHFLPWQKEKFDLHESDRFCLLSGLSYNHLHRDVFTPLALGAIVYVPPADIVREPKALTDWFRANSISVLHLTPALAQLLLTAGAQPLPSVRRVFVGGDVLTGNEITMLRSLMPNARIGSFYGATETQRAVGYYEIAEGSWTEIRDANRPIPLGRGIKDVQLLLLNSCGELAGVGELAELYVRSPHLAEGYIGDEALTRQRFITNPFTNDSKDRLYRTGELGRYLPDGNVEWAGRNDRRVNIRGFRVELEEIESVLRQHPIVKDAAVVLSDFAESDSGNAESKIQNPKLHQRLLAYVAADEPSSSTGDLLHGYLSARLPGYMVPSHFVVLEQLPVSPNGKIDYGALPPLMPLPSASSSPMGSSRNEVEATLSAVFSDVLGREHIGIEENFFRIGGHSLLAAQAAARIREVFGVGLELRTFLDSPTIAALAKHVALRLKPANATPGAEDDGREEIEL